MKMKLVDVLESLEELIFNKEIYKHEECQAIEKENKDLHDNILKAIAKIEDKELRKQLHFLFDEFNTIQNDRMSFSQSYAYKKGAMIAQAFSKF